MSGDYTRRTYDPRRDVAGVFEQQGRVRVDADLNELVEVVDRRFRTTTMDTLHASAGRVVVPAETPDAFAIAITGAGLTIGPGRAYVEGIQADNHGIGVPLPALHFERGIEELVGTDPLPFSPQPYVPTPYQPPPQGQHLAYLDVWHRERTKDEDPGLLDPALYGIDTATRRQIVWQVKLLENVRNVRCDTPIDQIPGLPLASASRLTTAAIGVPAADDPCEIPATGGYRGVTNRLYRVEIHDGGGLGAATFKWSRNGGSGGTSVIAINGVALTVAQLGRDKSVRFAKGDRVEVLDDIRELEGRPGEMAVVDAVDEDRGIVRLLAPLAGPFPTPAANGCRLRRWDQRIGVPASGVLPVTNAAVVLEDGVQIQFSLDAEIAGGQFESHEYWLFAARASDSSVEALDVEPPVGPHHHVGKLAIVDTGAGTVVDCRHPWPPSVGGDGCECDECVHAEDQRVDPTSIQQAVDAVRDKGGIVCLGAGIFILERPVRITRATSVTIRGKGWRTIVLTPGSRPAFVIEQSVGVTIEDLSVFGVRSVPRDGGQVRAPAAGGPPPPVAVAGPGLGLRAPSFDPVGLIRLAGGRTAIAVTNSVRVLVERCVLAIRPRTLPDAPVIALQGILADLTIRENVIVGSTGIGNLQRSKVTRALANKAGAPTLTDHFETVDEGTGLNGSSDSAEKRRLAAARLSRLLLIRSRIVDNIIGASVSGVAYGPFSIHVADHIVADNTILSLLGAGTVHMGVALFGCTTVRGNTVYAGRFGIASGLDGMRVNDNDVFGFGGRAARGDGGDDDRGTVDAALVRMVALPPAGIVLVDGLGFNRPLEGARISGNRVTGVRGFGILGASRVSTLNVDHNSVSECAAGGIVLMGLTGGAVSIDDNSVERIRGGEERAARAGGDLGFYLARFVAGIAVLGVVDADVRDNRVETVRASGRGQSPVGVLALSCASTRIAGNRVVDTGDGEGFAVGIAVGGTFDKADVVDDHVRIGERFERDQARQWIGIVITGFGDDRKVGAGDPVAVAASMSNLGKYQRIHIESDRPYVAELFGKEFVRLIPLGRELVAARGNTVDGGGQEPLINLAAGGHVTLNDNRVVSDPFVKQSAVVTVSPSLIASGNYVEIQRDAMAMELSSPETASTILGNVTNGRIEWNGNDLHTMPPWGALNVSA